MEETECKKRKLSHDSQPTPDGTLDLDALVARVKQLLRTLSGERRREAQERIFGALDCGASALVTNYQGGEEPDVVLVLGADDAIYRAWVRDEKTNALWVHRPYLSYDMHGEYESASYDPDEDGVCSDSENSDSEDSNGAQPAEDQADG